MKQESLDRELLQLKANLIHDVVTIKINYGNVASQRMNQVTVASFVTGAKLPRADQEQLTPQELDIKQAVERSKKRIQEVEETYYRDVDGLIAGAKERLGGMVAQTGQMNSQLKKPSGNIQLVPLGTDMYTRNYINFGERPELNSSGAASAKIPAAQPVPLHAVAKKMSGKIQSNAAASGTPSSHSNKSPSSHSSSETNSTSTGNSSSSSTSSDSSSGGTGR
jgi:hypothetical protein